MNIRKSMNSAADEMLEPYEQFLREEERNQATVGKYLRDVRKFRGYVRAAGKETFDKAIALGYKRYLSECYKTTSVNPMLAAINSYFDYLGRDECKMKLFKIQRAQFSEKRGELTEKDYGRLVHTAERRGDVRMNMLLRTTGSTGIRISELRLITVEFLGDGRTDIYNKEGSRITLFPVELVKVLKRYCRKAGILLGSIFITRSGKMMDRSNVNERMKQFGREAGIDTVKVFPHNFRHLFARIFYSIEEDMVRLMDLLGHSNISTTRIYTMSTEEQPRRQISRMKLMLG